MTKELNSDDSDPALAPAHRRRLIWGLIVGGLVLGGIAWLVRDPVPEFQGRKLSERLADLVRPSNSGSYQAASNALVALGDRALPVIVREIERPTPWHIRLLLQRQSKLKPAIRDKLFRWLDPYRYSNRRLGAVRGLEMLGTNAAPVAADLVVAFGRADAEIASQMSQALVRVGPAMVPPLRPYLVDPDLRKRSLTAFVLHQLGPQSIEAAPELIAGMAGADENHRRMVAQTLGRMGPAVLPQVTALLTSDDPETRLVAVRALNELLPRARDLTPELVGMLDDPSPEVRYETASLLVDWWNLPTEEWRQRFQTLPDDHPSRALYGRSLDALEACESRLVEVLRERLTATDPKLRLQAATRLVGLNHADAEVVQLLQNLRTERVGAPWELARVTNLLDRAQRQLAESSLTVPPQTRSRPDTVPVGQSPP